ncbi:copper amine oxidase-like protein [Collibacillus ludicampi]|uniref:Copper amine oxidase-like protein n=1 Tax=Collibacillus ludicampi TaxID=2771369 RepID=A0AAV4LCW2_9BACL|nr:copper amine oxidase N-terminal domain-containing protein [Collibacillus ludicampi]GIM45670.1 copper amine oxidase-like protein [Collibacillus ludicampi]
MKKGKKFLAVLSTSAMLASVPAVAGIAGTAVVAHAAASTVTAFTVPTIANSTTSGSYTTDLGTISMTIPGGALKKGDTVTLSLPHGFTFTTVNPNVGTVADSTYNVSVYQTQGSQGIAGLATVTPISNNQIKIVINNDPVSAVSGGSNTNGATSPTDDIKINVALHNITVNGPSSGPVNVTLAAPTSSAFPTGSVTVANVQSNGAVDVAVSDTTSGSNTFTFNLTLSEELAGSLKTDNNALKLKLPSGYVWDGLNGSVSQLYGDPANSVQIVSGTGTDTLYLKATNASESTASAFKIPLKFEVNDSTLTHNGPINVYISGTSTVNTTSAQVGTYGDYSASVSAASTPTILAGKSQQTIGDIIIKESVPGTFVDGRTVELTLPDSARWEDVFENAVANGGTPNSTSGPNASSTGWIPTINYTTTNGLNVTATYTGTDYRTLKLTFHGVGSQGNTDPGEVDIKNVQIATSARANGDINLSIGGTAGVTGTVKVATAQAPGTITVSDVKNVEPGKAGQAIGDITVTEAKAGAFDRDSVQGVANKDQVILKLDAPGVQWDQTPTVTVTSGDAHVTNVYTNGNLLVFTLDSASAAAPSTFKISGGTIKLDNTTPVGPIPVKLQGEAVDYAANKITAWSSDTTTVAKATVANVNTGLFGQTSGTAQFTIGSTSYTVNGQTLTADVAPYIKNNRTYVPVTYVAQALGVPLQNIIWNGNDSSVTIFKGSTVIRMVIGNNVLTVNGTPLTMDVAPEITNSRTFLPIAWLAQVLGVPYNWDATNQTISLGN